MLNRRNQVLTGILVAQVVLAVVMLWPSSEAARGVAEALVAEARAGDITGLTIRDNEGKQIHLAKRGGRWVLPEADDYPVDEKKAEEFVGKIAALETGRVVARSGSSHARLKVAEKDYERRIDLSLADGTEHALYIGSTVNARASHVRDARHDEVYLADDLSSWQAGTDPASWIDAEYFKVDENSVARMTIRNGQGQFAFDRTAAGNWSMRDVPRGRQFDADKATGLLRRITSLRLRAPVGKQQQAAFGFERPSAVVEVTVRESAAAPVTASGGNAQPPAAKEATRTLSIGGKGSEENTYVVRSSESAYYVEVSSWSVEDFVTQGRDYFLGSSGPS